MKYLYIIIIFIFNSYNVAIANEKCEGMMAKLKKECNIVGKSMDKIKEFSKENKTIDQSFRNIKEKFKKKNEN